MPDLVAGLACACAASALFDIGVALQALEARETRAGSALSPRLLGDLVQRRRWLAGTLIAVAGWPLHVAALTLAPLSVVQPALAVGLLLLLALGERVLGERVGPREIVAVAAIVVGVAGMAWAAPAHASTHAGPGRVAPALALIGAVAVAPYVLRRRVAGGSVLVAVAAGTAYAFTGISSKLIADYLGSGSWAALALWAPLTGAVAALGLLSEMSALQRRPATQVVPIVFVFQICVPVGLAPFLGGESWAATPLGGLALLAFLAAVAAGIWLLGSTRAVSGLVAASHRPAAPSREPIGRPAPTRSGS
jgi:drug/metabolite transporter (DMT)-like permease